MACRHDWEPNGLLKVFSGTVHGDDFRASIDVTSNSRRFDSLEYVINDFTGIDGHELDRTDVRYLLAVRRSYPHLTFDVALVTTDPTLTSYFEREIEESGSTDAAVFATVAAARQWFKARGRSVLGV